MSISSADPLIVPDGRGYYVNCMLFQMLIEGVKVLESSGESPKEVMLDDRTRGTVDWYRGNMR